MPRVARARLKFHIPTLISSLALGLSLNSAFGKDPALLSLSMEHFRNTATAKDDPTASAITISTENGFVEHTGPMRTVWNDEFLLAVIDKKTNRKSFQVYTSIVYSGDPRSYRTAKYMTAKGPQSIPTIQLRREAVNCEVGPCTYTEHVAFPIDEELLRQLAAGYAPGHPSIWSYKLSARSGPDFSAALSNAEIAGLLAKVDEYTNALATNALATNVPETHALATSAPALNAPAVNAPAVNALPLANVSVEQASLKVDLGIGGLPVDANAEQPNRAGVLVIEVKRGSVAQKSGIIVGDILHEFAGHSLKTLADLQAAVAGRTANSVVAIKLYRGTTDMAVTAQF
jgi:PDZ domain